MSELPSDSFERASLSLDTLQILCKFAAGDVNYSFTTFPKDWEDVLHGVSRNGLVGITHYYLTHYSSQGAVPTAFKDAVAKTFRTVTMQQGLKYWNVYQVLSQLHQAKLNYLVVKGPAVANSLYPDPSTRIFNDLDIVVREHDWTRAHQLLIACGYEQEEGLPEPPPKIVPAAVTYEVKYVHHKTGFRIEVHYDDLLNSGLASRDIEGFWARTCTIDIKGVPVKVLSLEDQLIHLCAHAHYHGYVRLNWFTDLALLVRDHAAQLDWNRMLQTVKKEEAQVPVYYTLYFLEKLLGVYAPAWVMSALKPDRFRCWAHDKYMPQAKVLSFQPMWRPDLSFYFVPLFKRMLPDLLIMGRRREKLMYLVHLLAPPKLWLRYYYRLGYHSRVEIHYILHPLKLVANYLRETFNELLNPKTNWS